MNNQNRYPQSVEELDLDNVVLAPEVVAVVKAFAKTHPWRGTLEEKIQKLLRLNSDVALAMNVRAPRLVFEIDESVDSGRSSYCPATKTITLNGRYSIVTFLHETAHHLFGPSEYTACAWSLALFKRVFPVSFSHLKWVDHMCFKPNSNQ
jgi:hypothetical protein